MRTGSFGPFPSVGCVGQTSSDLPVRDDRTFYTGTGLVQSSAREAECAPDTPLCLIGFVRASENEPGFSTFLIERSLPYLYFYW